MMKHSVSPIRCRMTREGYHFLFILSFVLIGAVLRSPQLLVVFAGVLVAMLFLQWRLCRRTLDQVRLTREFPLNAQATIPFEIQLTATNYKRWLGSWLLVVHDRIRRETPSERGNPGVQGINMVVENVPPNSSRLMKYRCRVEQRGRYEFGPVDLSTRFPLSLLRSMRSQNEVEHFIVHPKQGTILPRWRELFDRERYGNRRHHARAGTTEGEFYGLRSYRPGDSPRWIHWRTTARRSELVVKQFERQENLQACLMIDLWCPKQGEGSTNGSAHGTQEDAVETAIEFVASLTQLLVGKGLGSLTIGIADRNFTLISRIQSRNQVLALLDRLAIAEASHDADWRDGLNKMKGVVTAIPHLIVISTRSVDWTVDQQDVSRSVRSRLATWIDVSKKELQPYFQRGDR